MAEFCGVEWHPHLFRHLMARLLLEHDAGADSLVTRALGQKRAESTRYYTGFQTTAAIRKHDELLLQRRATILGPRKGGAK